MILRIQKKNHGNNNDPNSSSVIFRDDTEVNQILESNRMEQLEEYLK